MRPRSAAPSPGRAGWLATERARPHGRPGSLPMTVELTGDLCHRGGICWARASGASARRGRGGGSLPRHCAAYDVPCRAMPCPSGIINRFRGTGPCGMSLPAPALSLSVTHSPYSRLSDQDTCTPRWLASRVRGPALTCAPGPGASEAAGPRPPLHRHKRRSAAAWRLRGCRWRVLPLRQRRGELQGCRC